MFVIAHALLLAIPFTAPALLFFAGVAGLAVRDRLRGGAEPDDKDAPSDAAL